jgi:hypothetical protein
MRAVTVEAAAADAGGESGASAPAGRRHESRSQSRALGEREAGSKVLAERICSSGMPAMWRNTEQAFRRWLPSERIRPLAS